VLIDYFGDNLQFLYNLERQKEYIWSEWLNLEFIKPCFFKEESIDEKIEKIGGHKFVFHKSKKFIHFKRLED